MHSADRPVLSLTDLKAHDPTAPVHRKERRFLCPLPVCAGHQRGASHRSLVVNVESGAWLCHRCLAAGLLREYWKSRKERARYQLRRAFDVPCAPAMPAEAPRLGSSPVQPSWRDIWNNSEPVLLTPAAAYLHKRGIPVQLATAASVRFMGSFYGRPAVIFPVCDRFGAVVAILGRYVDGGTTPKGRAAGPRSCGVFTTMSALAAEPIVITEAPIDALSLAVVGIPAIALGGTSGPEWLPTVCAFRTVALALDADDAGEAACARWAHMGRAMGARMTRWRPAGGKDWNEVLVRLGAERLGLALRAAQLGATGADEQL